MTGSGIAFGVNFTEQQRDNMREFLWDSLPHPTEERMGVSIDVIMFDSVDEIPVEILAL